MAFGPDGRCERIPSQAQIPQVASVQAFELVEHGPLIWIWMGKAGAGDPSRIPDHPWLDSPEFKYIAGYIHVRCSYIRLHENVLDLTHFPFLHGDVVGDIEFARTPFEVEELGGGVRITRRLDNHLVSGNRGAAIGNLGHRVNRISDARFISPAIHVAHATVEDLDGGVCGRTEFHFKIQHMFTPETATSTHYFWASARDVGVDQRDNDDAMRNRLEATFKEDVDALEAIETIWSNEEEGFQEISIAADRAGLLMRRIIARRAQMIDF
jgi:vanillate O-demethylase monooxygenase subunit